MFFNFKRRIKLTTELSSGIAEANEAMDDLMNGVDDDLSAASREVQDALKYVEGMVEGDCEKVDSVLDGNN